MKGNSWKYSALLPASDLKQIVLMQNKKTGKKHLQCLLRRGPGAVGDKDMSAGYFSRRSCCWRTGWAVSDPVHRRRRILISISNRRTHKGHSHLKSYCDLTDAAFEVRARVFLCVCAWGVDGGLRGSDETSYVQTPNRRIITVTVFKATSLKRLPHKTRGNLRSKVANVNHIS